MPILLAALLASPCPLATSPQGPELELVETAPVETTLDHPELRETHEVWPEMIAAARSSIDLAMFYASARADDPGAPGVGAGRLAPVVAALEEAAARGVAVRFLADEGFHATYPGTLDRLAGRSGIEVRLLDLRPVTGGVLHAKYLVVDGREVFVGSQNFDWRSLEHIQELGVRVRSEPVARAFARVFETDWGLSGGVGTEALGGGDDAPPAAERLDSPHGPVEATPVFSPRELLPAGAAWDLPRILALIDGARERVSVQLLSYRTAGRGGEYWDELDRALRRAAARGVHVRLLLSHWSRRRGSIEALQSLQVVPRVDVRLARLPEAADGFVPYARVVHAKYLVVDGEAAWIGTSNWSRDYFHQSRNAGLILRGEGLAAELERFFETGWAGPYAAPVDPCTTYQSPRIGDG